TLPHLSLHDALPISRRIEHTGLNFTGGTTEQPLSFSSIETVGGVEVLTIAAGQFRTVRVIDDIEIGTPNSDGTVRRITLRSTMRSEEHTSELQSPDQ